MKHTLLALGAAALLAAAAPPPAQARCHGYGVAAGVVGGIAAGAILGSALAGRPVYAAPAPVYVEPPPPPPPATVYYDDDDGPICHIEHRRVWIEGYGWHRRRIEVCE